MAVSYVYATAVPATIPVAKTKVFIGTKASSLTSETFTEIGGVLTVPTFGPSDTPINIETVGYGLRLTEKGVTVPGGGDLTCAYIEGDAGQEACVTAQADKDGNYNIRMIFPNKPSTNGTGTIVDIKAKIMNAPIQAGGSNDFYKRAINLMFNSLPVYTDPAST